LFLAATTMDIAIFATAFTDIPAEMYFPVAVMVALWFTVKPETVWLVIFVPANDDVPRLRSTFLSRLSEAAPRYQDGHQPQWRPGMATCPPPI